jgi:hypothetical protein
MTVVFSPGAARSFASELIQVRLSLFPRTLIANDVDDSSLSRYSTAREPVYQPIVLASHTSMLSGLLPPSDHVGNHDDLLARG